MLLHFVTTVILRSWHHYTNLTYMDIGAAHTLAIELMRQHGLFVKGTLGCSNGYSWAFKWDSAKRRFGQCSYHYKIISLSKALVEINNETEVRDTILHEIAHALAGHQAGHGDQWKRKAREIGARPERCYTTDTTATITYKWHGKCKACGEESLVIRFSDPGWRVCKCWPATKTRCIAEGKPFNVGNHTTLFRRGEMLVKQPKSLANNPAPESPRRVLLVPGAPVVKPVEKAKPVENQPAPVEKPVEKAKPVETAPALAPGAFDAAKAVFLYQSGTKVVDIAVAMGYTRGQGQNRVRAALVKAGVYKQGEK